MTGKIKKAIASVLAVASLSTCSVGISASAASWSASHISGGAPGSASTTAYLTVYHKAAGASAICNTNTHTNTTATTGYTYINCTNYSMTEKKITKTGSATCNPDVGSPTVNIAVNYRVSAYTPTSPDTFWSKGNITAK